MRYTAAVRFDKVRPGHSFARIHIIIIYMIYARETFSIHNCVDMYDIILFVINSSVSQWYYYYYFFHHTIQPWARDLVRDSIIFVLSSIILSITAFCFPTDNA